MPFLFIITAHYDDTGDLLFFERNENTAEYRYVGHEEYSIIKGNEARDMIQKNVEKYKPECMVALNQSWMHWNSYLEIIDCNKDVKLIPIRQENLGKARSWVTNELLKAKLSDYISELCFYLKYGVEIMSK